MVSGSSGKKNSGYHHRSLRPTLVAATLQLVVERGLDAVSIRRVAVAAGVSEAAPYHHFSSKNELLAATAADSYRRFDAAQVAAIELAGVDPVDRVVALSRAYVRFMIEHPGEVHLMFGTHVESELAGFAEFHQVARQSKLRAQTAIYDALPTDLADTDRLAGFRTVWTQVHGIAVLATAGELGSDFDIEMALDLVTRAIRAQLTNGMTATATQ